MRDNNIQKVEKRYFFGIDFDGTAFNTFQPSPNDLDVREAYRLALRDIFGNWGEEIFEEIGFSQQAPSELTAELQKYAEARQYDYLKPANDFLEENKNILEAIVPNLGELTWNEGNPERTLTELLVRQKLWYLLNEIDVDKEGNIWPPPCDGFLKFYQKVQQLKGNGTPIDVAIISSGHESFIRRTFDIWGLVQPDILVTEDDIRYRRYPKELARKVKPGTFPFALAHLKWLGKLNKEGFLPLNEIIDTRKRMFYIGDSPDKDVEMGRRSGILTCLYPLTTWEAITDSMTGNKEMFFEGRAMAEILPRELFLPHDPEGSRIRSLERS